MNAHTNNRVFALTGAIGFASLLLLGSACKRAEPGTFDTPQEAVATLDELAAGGQDARVEEVFGPGSLEMFRSGDAEADKKGAERVRSLVAEKVDFEEIDENTQVALLGEEAWPFPIPLVKNGDGWRFDTEAGREELLNRRIGFNELATLASLHAYVDAQWEYHADEHDGKPRAFAQRFRSTEGQHDGLYWPVAEGEEPSPLGDLLAGAATLESPEPAPFRGYNYRILTAQGDNAPGGARSYLDDKGLLTRGFAAIAWPAKYGNSGVMTFLVFHRDIVFQKDFGPGTDEAAAAIESFDPDLSWTPTGDTIDDVVEDGEAGSGDAAADSTGG